MGLFETMKKKMKLEVSKQKGDKMTFLFITEEPKDSDGDSNGDSDDEPIEEPHVGPKKQATGRVILCKDDKGDDQVILVQIEMLLGNSELFHKTAKELLEKCDWARN